MRPITRGIRPKITFLHYRDAFPSLKANMGAYCSYCERRLPTNLAVEHVKPKSLHQSLALEWDNFLLACCNCNSSKGDVDVVLTDYIWPDSSNTLRAIEYSNGLVQNRLSLTDPAHGLVDALISLVGLDKDPGHPKKDRRPDVSDQRWKDRLDALDIARRCYARLATCNTVEMREIIVESALGWGYFAVWFEVFKNDLDMCSRLISAFPGTAKDCFDNYSPVQRPGSLC